MRRAFDSGDHRRVVTIRRRRMNAAYKATACNAFDGHRFTDAKRTACMVNSHSRADSRSCRASIHFAVGKNTDVAGICTGRMSRAGENRTV